MSKRENEEGRIQHRMWPTSNNTKTQKSRGNNEMMRIGGIDRHQMKTSRKRGGSNEKYWKQQSMESTQKAIQSHSKWQKLRINPTKFSEMKRLKRKNPQKQVWNTTQKVRKKKKTQSKQSKVKCQKGRESRREEWDIESDPPQNTQKHRNREKTMR